MSDAVTELFEGARLFALPKNHVLFQVGDEVRQVYWIVDGRVDLVRHSKAGSTLTLQSATANEALAEASVYSRHYHCTGIAREISKVRSMAVQTFHNRLNDDARLAAAWAKNMAETLQTARTHSEIRTLRTVEDRLDAWLELSGPLPPKGRWQRLASILGVSREALYREIAKRR